MLDYTAVQPAQRPAKLHHKFIDILAVLLQNGLDVNDADYRSVFRLNISTKNERRGMKSDYGRLKYTSLYI